METRNIEKLLTDLKNLPKQNAPEDFEEKLLLRISNYERQKSSGESQISRLIRMYFNPVYVPALTIVIVAIVIVYTLDRNQLNHKNHETVVDKAIPIIQETATINNEPQKISIPKKKDFVVKRSKEKLNLGPGISLDEPEFTSNPSSKSQPAFVGFPFPDEPVVIRIPPPEILFRNELESMGINRNNHDSIKLTKTRRR
jgi:hypothetical protein